jgi:hypothetical protein
MQLRAVLSPLHYTGAARAFSTGVAFVHPMYHGWPGEDQAYDRAYDYQVHVTDAFPVVYHWYWYRRRGGDDKPFIVFEF